MSVNSEIRDAIIQHAVWLERYKAGEVARILALLNKSEKEAMDALAAGLAGIEERGYDIGDKAQKKADDLIANIKAKRSSAYGDASATVAGNLKELAHYETGFAAQIITGAAGGALEAVKLTMPPAAQIDAAVTKKPFQGRLLREWFNGLERADGQRIADAVKIGIIEGRTTDQIVRQIRGTKALNYSDGILEISRRDARSVVSTATAHVANTARDDLYAANDDILVGEQWLATLDSRTCPRCGALDGKVFKIGAAPKRPLHFGPCRCTTVPYFGETETQGTRASQDGPVPEKTTYEQWLKSQKPDVQDDILGEARAKLFREGNLKLDRFSNPSGKAYTLEELRKRDKGVFDDVFANSKTPTAAQRVRQEAEFKEYLGPATYARMKNGVAKAMEASGVSSYGLTDAEKVAVHAYTTGDKYYERLNSALRSNNAEAIARVAPMARVLDSAVAKLPAYEGPVLFRVSDLPEAVSRKVRAGNVYADPAFMSASKADLGKTFGADYRFTIIRSTQGKDINGFSFYPHEQEVLFARGTKFDILQTRADKRTGFTEVTLSDKKD